MAEEIVLTQSLEDYLEAIFLLERQLDTVRITDITEAMQISKPSVNRAINVLKKAGLLEHEHYGTVSLTEAGRDIARNIAAKHKLLKQFLIHRLKVHPEVAEKEACDMEHVVSQNTIEKLSAYLGDESVD
jgi:DtxR family Mn-dependent transcriptional regulator